VAAAPGRFNGGAVVEFIERSIASLRISCKQVVVQDVFGVLISGYVPNPKSRLYSSAFEACVNASNIEAAAVRQALEGVRERLRSEWLALVNRTSPIPPSSVVSTLAASASRVLALEGNETIEKTVQGIKNHFEKSFSFGAPLLEVCTMYAQRAMNRNCARAKDIPPSVASALMVGAPRIMAEVLVCGIGSSLPIWPQLEGQNISNWRPIAAHANAAGEEFVADFTKIDLEFRPAVVAGLEQTYCGRPCESARSWLWGNVSTKEVISRWARFAAAVEVDQTDSNVASALIPYLAVPDVNHPPFMSVLHWQGNKTTVMLCEAIATATCRDILRSLVSFPSAGAACGAGSWIQRTATQSCLNALGGNGRKGALSSPVFRSSSVRKLFSVRFLSILWTNFPNHSSPCSLNQFHLKALELAEGVRISALETNEKYSSIVMAINIVLIPDIAMGLDIRGNCWESELSAFSSLITTVCK
jgi:hypothetical protein